MSRARPGTQVLPVCPVCGEAREDAVVVGCATCQTLHHEDCWSYTGSCATFGCGSRRREGEAAPELPPARHEWAANHECPSCRGPWKEEKAMRCARCERAYHYQCWQANDGCLLFSCRRAEEESRIAPTLLSGLGRANCRICSQSCHGEKTVVCGSCSRPYHLACWEANSGCVRHVCRFPLMPGGSDAAPLRVTLRRDADALMLESAEEDLLHAGALVLTTLAFLVCGLLSAIF